MVAVKLAIDADLLKYGVIHWHMLNFPTHCHLLVTGQTGSGKSYFCRSLLGRISIQGASLTFLDFKCDDMWSFLKTSPNCYFYTDVLEGLKQFYLRFLKRQSGEDSSRSLQVLFIDEWIALVNALSKSDSESAKKILANILLLGRSMRVHVILGVQRPDANVFTNSGSRDQFGATIALGRLSTEAKTMIGIDRGMKPVSGRGYGYMILGGMQSTIYVPPVSDVKKLERYIKQAVQRTN